MCDTCQINDDDDDDDVTIEQSLRSHVTIVHSLFGLWLELGQSPLLLLVLALHLGQLPAHLHLLGTHELATCQSSGHIHSHAKTVTSQHLAELPAHLHLLGAHELATCQSSERIHQTL